MKASGIVAEYNPLHNGHIYHLGKTRELTGCDAVAVAMSGDYVQRGEPAIMDKWTRAGHALRSGADLVIEIPVLYCLGNARQYASAGVRLLESLGCVDSIAFGSECGDLESLSSISAFIREHSADLAEEIRKYIKSGMNYPVARARAYEALRGDLHPDRDICKELRILDSSNDILSLEYISAMKTASPVAIKREGAGYSDPYDIKFDYQSAGTLRTRLFDERDIDRYIPECTSVSVRENHLTGPDADRWFDLLRYAVLTMPACLLEDCPSGGEGLANLMKSKAADTVKWTQFVRRVKSKRYTYTRISRLCMQSVLGITMSCFGSALSEPHYIRILGFNDTGRKLLSEIKGENKAGLPLLTNINKEMHLLSDDAQKLLKLDIHASDIYNLATGQDMNRDSDHRRGPVIIK